MSMVDGVSGRKVRKCYERIGYPIEVFEESLTQQQYADECDVNNILKRHRDMNVNLDVGGTPMFGDFANVPSYHEAMNVVVEARTQFDALPSDVRTRFGNDPQLFFDFMQNNDNYEEAVKLGLCQRNVDPEPVTVRVVSEPAAPAISPAVTPPAATPPA